MCNFVGLSVTALASALSLATGAAHAEALRYSEPRESTIEVGGVSTLEVYAGAGELRIRGGEARDEVLASGEAHASRADLLAEILLHAQRDGDRMLIRTDMPQDGQTAFDLELEVPAALKLVVHDTSGDVEVRGVAELELQDSSGDIDVQSMAGDVSIRDSSGNIRVRSIDGHVQLSDSSGDIVVDEIVGSVTVSEDSSGDIRVRHGAS